VCVFNSTGLIVSFYILIRSKNSNSVRTNIHNAVLFSVKEKPIIEKCKLGIRGSHIRLKQYNAVILAGLIT